MRHTSGECLEITKGQFQATIRGERAAARIGGATEPALLGSENVLVEEWIAAIRSRQRCRCDAELGYNAMAIAEAAISAQAQGRVIEFGGKASGAAS